MEDAAPLIAKMALIDDEDNQTEEAFHKSDDEAEGERNDKQQRNDELNRKL
jgi:hypothetical protein